jgi:hypothetical protein
MHNIKDSFKDVINLRNEIAYFLNVEYTDVSFNFVDESDDFYIAVVYPDRMSCIDNVKFNTFCKEKNLHGIIHVHKQIVLFTSSEQKNYDDVLNQALFDSYGLCED